MVGARSGPVQHRRQHRIRQSTPPCRERGLQGSSRSEEFAVAGARPGRESFPLCSAAELVSLIVSTLTCRETEMPPPRQLAGANKIFVDRETPQQIFEDAAFAVPVDHSIICASTASAGRGRQRSAAS